MMIVRELFPLLPKGYTSSPNVNLGRLEIDVAAFEGDDVGPVITGEPDEEGGVATLAPPEVMVTYETGLTAQDEYEVKIYDTQVGRRLVAAIELVSPSNKDRADHRKAFVDKVTGYLRQDVCVSIVDLVTERHHNLYNEALETLCGPNPKLKPEPSHTYAATLRRRSRVKGPELIDGWIYPMPLGKPLPTLPIFLAPGLHVMLPLEPSYEETCRLLHIS